jgi:hypothetical protein
VEPGYAQAVKGLNATRISHINARVKDNPDWDKWVILFRDYIPKSKFLCGLIPPNGQFAQFRLNIDWLTNEANFMKIREGKYHGQ